MPKRATWPALFVFTLCCSLLYWGSGQSNVLPIETQKSLLAGKRCSVCSSMNNYSCPACVEAERCPNNVAIGGQDGCATPVAIKKCKTSVLVWNTCSNNVVKCGGAHVRMCSPVGNSWFPLGCAAPDEPHTLCNGC